MLTFFYKGGYDPELLDPCLNKEDDESVKHAGLLIFHAVLYSLGDKYECSQLQDYASSRFRFYLDKVSLSAAVSTISTVYSTTPYANRTLRDPLVKKFADVWDFIVGGESKYALTEAQHEALKSEGEFNYDLLKAFSRRFTETISTIFYRVSTAKWWFVCPTCGTDKEYETGNGLSYPTAGLVVQCDRCEYEFDPMKETEHDQPQWPRYYST